MNILEKAIKEGNYELSCGKSSPFLIDTAQILRTKEGQDYVRSLRPSFDFTFDKMGGPLSGADLLCPALGAKEWFGVRDSPKGRGTDRGKITGNLEVGDKVLLVEDVCTTGNTLIRALNEVTSFGAIPVGVFILIERKDIGDPSGKIKELYPDIKIKSLFSFIG